MVDLKLFKLMITVAKKFNDDYEYDIIVITCCYVKTRKSTLSLMNKLAVYK